MKKLALITFLLTSSAFASFGTNTKIQVKILHCSDNSVIKLTQVSQSQNTKVHYKILKQGQSGILIAQKLLEQLQCKNI